MLRLSDVPEDTPALVRRGVGSLGAAPVAVSSGAGPVGGSEADPAGPKGLFGAGNQITRMG